MLGLPARTFLRSTLPAATQCLWIFSPGASIVAMTLIPVDARTYPALVTGAVHIIREKRPHTPMALISPFGFPPHEIAPSAAGYTIGGMRQDMEAVQQRFVAQGDRNLYYVSGLEIFDLDEIVAHTPDQCHANTEGIDIQADHFGEKVMPLLLGTSRAR